MNCWNVPAHICREMDGPYFYETALESDSLLLKEAKERAAKEGL